MLVYTQTYSAQRLGTTIRRVSCEKCSGEYYYELVRVGMGQSTTIYGLNKSGASRHAAIKAENDIRKLLQYCHDPVPCPDCQLVQTEMRWQVAVTHARQWLFNAFACLIFGVVIAAIVLGATSMSGFAWIIGASFSAAILMGIVGYYFRLRCHDEHSFALIPAGSKRLLAPPALIRQVDSNGLVVLEPAKVPELSGTTFVAQFARYGLPEYCAMCAEPTTHLYLPPIQVATTPAAVRCCEACSRKLRRKCWLAMILMSLSIASSIWLACSFLGLDQIGRTLTTALGSIPGMLGAGAIAARSGRAIAVWDVDGWRGWSGVRPRTTQFAARITEMYSSKELYSVVCPEAFREQGAESR